MGADEPGPPSGFRARPRAAELTGEIPVFVAERLADHADDALSDDDLEVVEALQDLGLDEEAATAAVRDHRVPLVLMRQVLGEQRTLGIDDLAGTSGVPADVLLEIRAALGLPRRDDYGPTELEWAEQIARLLALVPVEALLSGARSHGQSMWAIAMGDLSIVRDELVLPMRKAGADDLTVAVALAETAKALQPVTQSLLRLTYRMVTEHLLGTEIAAVATRGVEAQLDLAVGFVDVVGYTALSARIDPEGLDEVLDAFEQHVVDVVSEAPHVGVVKYLGDAVMLVASDPGSMAATLLDLVEQTPALAEAPLKGGMASGPVLVREGDYFGQPVNMAARLTDHARAWTLLADEHLLDVLDGPFDVKRILPTRVRGFGLRRPLAVRRTGWDEEE